MKRYILPTRFQLAVLAFVWLALLPLTWLFTKIYQFSFWYRLDPARYSEWPRARRTESLEALAQMEAFAKAKGHPLPLFNRPTARRLCVGVVSVRRLATEDGQPLAYLSQTMAGLLTRIPWHLQDRLRITLYNVDADPEGHAEAKAISRLVHTVSPDYGRMTGGLTAQDILAQGGVIYKENLDYQAAVQHQLSLECQYSLLLEDDSLAAPDWYAQVEQVIDALSKSRNDGTWHYAKLYTTLMFEGYQNDPWSVAELLLTALGAALLLFLTVSIVLLLIDLVMQQKNRILLRKSNDPESSQALTGHEMAPSPFLLTRRWILDWTLGQILLAFGLGAMATLLIGRQNIRYSPYSPRHLYPAPICISSQAMLYPRDQLFILDKYLTEHRDPKMLAKDLHAPHILAESKHKDLQIYSWLPDIFQHIGLYSTLRVSQHSLANMKYSTHFRYDQEPIRFNSKLAEL